MAASHSPSNKYQFVRGNVVPEATIIAVGGGKGGIGKSFVSSSIAIFLANLGHETYLLDLDLGGANLHTTLGEGLPKIGINEFLTDTSLTLADTAVQTAYPNLKLIAGSSDLVDMADINDFQRSRLMSSLYKLKSKFIVLDLSAGSHHNTLDFFLMASHKVVVFTPEPSSIENAYRFLKAAFYRKIRRYEDQLQLGHLMGELMGNRTKLGLRSPSDLLKTIAAKDVENGMRLQKLMSDLNCEIILNQVRSLKDADLGPSIQGVCTKYFGVPFNYLGHIEYDNAVWQALRKRRHLLTEYPHSRVYAQMMAITRRLSSPLQKRAMVL
ncbi:MAG: P-loop NTPase [Bdellovibrionales bacterium]